MPDTSIRVDSTGPIRAVIHDEQRDLFYYGSAGSVYSFDPKTGTSAFMFNAALGTVEALAMSADGKSLVIGFSEVSKIIDVPLATFDDKTTFVNWNFPAPFQGGGIGDVVVAADGRILAGGNNQWNTIGSFSIDSPNGNLTVTSLPNVSGSLHDPYLIASDHHRYVLAGDANISSGKMILYDTQTNTVAAQTYLTSYPTAQGIDVNEEARLIVKSDKVYDFTLNLVAQLPQANIIDSKFYDDGHDLVTFDQNGNGLIWDTTTFAQIGSIDTGGPDGAPYVNGMEFSNDGKYLFLTGVYWTGSTVAWATWSVDLSARMHINATGTSHADTLRGSVGSDTLSGGDGDDLLIDNGGNDSLDGGAGSDTLSYAPASAGVMVSLLKAGVAQDTGGAGVDTLISIENLIGSAYADSLSGDNGANRLDGGSGADTLTGGLGDDTYVVDNAGDLIVEKSGEGTDTVLSTINWTLSAEVENLTLLGSAAVNGTGNALANIIAGNDGANMLSGLDGNDTILGQGGADSIFGGEGLDSLSGGNGDDSLDGGASNDRLFGGAGNDVLQGGSGGDTMFGGAGNDSYYVDNIGDSVNEQSTPGVDDGGYDKVASSINYTLAAYVEELDLAGSSNINGTGNSGDNWIVGNGGNNVLSGMGGNDTIVATAGGVDTLIGGNGNDVYWISNGTTVITETSNTDWDAVWSTTSYTLSTNVEELDLLGAGNINATGNGGDNLLSGNTGANMLDGSAGNDLLYGNAGNDTLDGGADVDTMYGGAGNDFYYVDSIGDVASEQSQGAGIDDGGYDRIITTVSYTLGAFIEELKLMGTDNLTGTGNASNNAISGNAGNNLLYGLGGNDVIKGLGGADTMFGGSGNDSYIVDNASQVASEESTGAGHDDGGNDTVTSAVSFTLGSFIENLVLTGSGNLTGTGNATNNILTGNGGDNLLSGLNAHDTLLGGDGNDTLIGGTGNDILNGGAGADQFVFAAAAINGKDTVQDFVHGADQLVFTGADYGFGSGHTLTASEFTAGSAAIGASAQFIWDATSHTLYWDDDGTGGHAAIAIATFGGGATVDASDFHFS